MKKTSTKHPVKSKDKNSDLLKDSNQEKANNNLTSEKKKEDAEKYIENPDNRYKLSEKNQEDDNIVAEYD